MSNVNLIAEARRNAPESVDESLIMRLVVALEASEPRTVTTEEELDALPHRTVILDGIGRAFQRWNLAGWQKAGPSIAAHDPRLPATILYDPKAEATR